MLFPTDLDFGVLSKKSMFLYFSEPTINQIESSFTETWCTWFWFICSPKLHNIYFIFVNIEVSLRNGIALSRHGFGKITPMLNTKPLLLLVLTFGTSLSSFCRNLGQNLSTIVCLQVAQATDGKAMQYAPSYLRNL